MSYKQFFWGLLIVCILGGAVAWTTSTDAVSASINYTPSQQMSEDYESIIIQAADESGKVIETQIPFVSQIALGEIVVALQIEEALADGAYSYTLIYLPAISEDVAAQLAAAANGSDREQIVDQLTESGGARTCIIDKRLFRHR